MQWLLGASFTWEKLEFVHWMIRKGGHLTEYGILASALWWALGSVNAFSSKVAEVKPRFGTRFSLTFVVAALYAASDEFHQSFIPTRTASMHDVMIDSFGAALALAAIGIFYVQKHRLAI